MNLNKLTGRAKKARAAAEAIQDPGGRDEPSAAPADKPFAWLRT
jgi:hypothetical protein